MKPEQLKVIAEGMGYEAHMQNDYNDANWQTGTTVIIKFRDRGWVDYHPDTHNNDQVVEIIVKLKLSLWFDGVTWIAELKNGPRYVGMKINEAVCNAAYEYFKEDV